MHHGDSLQFFVETTLGQYVPGLLASTGIPVEPPSAPIVELDPNDVVDDTDTASDDDILAESVRAIYLEQ
jgi:hypothetical protein